MAHKSRIHGSTVSETFGPQDATSAASSAAAKVATPDSSSPADHTRPSTLIPSPLIHSQPG